MRGMRGLTRTKWWTVMCLTAGAWGCAAVVTTSWAEDAGAPAAAAPVMSAPAKTDFLQAIQGGAVDWSSGIITGQGEGAVAANAPNAGSARLGAIRAAKADALRNILEMIRQIHVTSEPPSRTRWSRMT